MSEGAHHARLVEVLLDAAHGHFGSAEGVWTWADQPASGVHRVPFMIGEVRPDVYLRSATGDRVLLGEAKTARDIDNPHTHAQLKEYFEHLASERGALLWMAVPLQSAGEAFRVARSIRAASSAAHVPFIVSGWLLGRTTLEKRWHG